MPISESRPWVSNSLGCPKSEVEATREELKHRGIKGADINDKGQLVCHSRKARKEATEMFDDICPGGRIDLDGGYGDFTGRSR